MDNVSHKSLMDREGKSCNLIELIAKFDELPNDKGEFEDLLHFYNDLKVSYDELTRKTVVRIVIELPYDKRENLITDAIENYIQLRKDKFLEKCQKGMK